MSLCKSCQAEIIWHRMVLSGKQVPLDKEPVDEGNIVIRNSMAHVLSANNPVQPDEARYVSHFATCEHASEHRRPR